MGEYPKYFPPFMRDFHDRKDVVKAFYTWVDMMDTVQEKDKGKSFDPILRKRRVQMCSWVDFLILLCSFIDFLHVLGYAIQKKRGSDVSDIDQNIMDLKTMPEVLHNLTHTEEHPRYTDAYCIKVMDRWKNWHPYLPADAVEAYRKLKAAQEG